MPVAQNWSFTAFTGMAFTTVFAGCALTVTSLPNIIFCGNLMAEFGPERPHSAAAKTEDKDKDKDEELLNGLWAHMQRESQP